MGNLCTPPSSTNLTQMETTKKIDQQIIAEKKKVAHVLLLLGTGESGKSTFAKQMRIIHLQGFTNEKLRSYIPIVHTNILTQMQVLIQAVFDVEQQNNLTQANKEAAQYFLRANLIEQKLSHELAQRVKSLWQDPVVKARYENAHEFQLNDNMRYFFDKVEEFAQDNYIPSQQDILLTRVRSTGVDELRFNYNNAEIKLVDVGGQRSERRKWVHVFHGVTSILFFVALSEYDLMLRELNVNRMHESLTLFKEIVNCKWFAQTSVVLFLNKSDLFFEKIKRVCLSVCFQEYTGGNDYDAAIKYIARKFKGQQLNQEKPLYVHVTNSTDTDNIRFVFKAVSHIVLSQSIDQSF